MDYKIVILFVVISSFNPVNMYDISVISKGKGFHIGSVSFAYILLTPSTIE